MSNMLPRIRENGVIKAINTLGPVTHDDLQGILKAILPAKGLEEVARHGNFDASYHVDNIRLRLNIGYVFDAVGKTEQGLQVSARILSSVIPSLNAIGFPEITGKEIVV